MLASGWVLAQGLTVSNLFTLLTYHPPRGAPPLVLPYDGVPIVLGLVPLVFSAALFVLPMMRALVRMRQEKKVAEENARLAILREVLTRATKKEPVPDTALRHAYRVATGVDPTSKEITARVVDLGGDVDVGPEGRGIVAIEAERARCAIALPISRPRPRPSRTSAPMRRPPRPSSAAWCSRATSS